MEFFLRPADRRAVDGLVCLVTAAGFQVPTAAMREAADGIDALVGELGSLTTAGRAGQGRGVPAVELDAEQLGHDGLAGACAQFCLRWDWGVRALVQDGTDMADGLRESVESYQRSDDGVGAAFSQILGDPAADPSVERTPSGTVEDAARDMTSPERWSQAGSSIADSWAAVARDARDTVEQRWRLAEAGEDPFGPDLDALREIVD